MIPNLYTAYTKHTKLYFSINVSIKALITFLTFFLSLKNSNAQIIDWAFSIGSPEDDLTYTEDIDIDPWGNIYITGRYDDNMDIDPGPGEYILESDGYTYFIAKYNPDGEIIFGYGLENVDFFRCIHIDEEGNLYMSGKLGDECCVDFDFGPADSILIYFPGTNGDYFAIYNSSMALQRIVQFEDEINMITKTSDIYDNIIVTAEIAGSDEVDIDPGPGTYLLEGPINFLAKYDKGINLKWAYTYSDAPNALEVTTDDSANIYIQNVYELYLDTIDFDFGPDVLSISDSDILAKYDSLGNLLWLNKYEFFKSNYYEINAAGEIYTLGEIFGGGYPYDIDPGPSEYIVIADPNPTYYFAKYSNDNQFLWAKLISADIELIIQDIELDDSSNIYLTGKFLGTADFDPGPGFYPLENILEAGHPFLAKYDSSGNILWASQLYGIGGGQKLEAVNNSETILAGDFSDYTFFVGEDSIPLPWVGHSDYFLIKYLQEGCSAAFLIVDSIQHMTCSSPGYASVYYDGIPPYLYLWNTVPPQDSSYTIINYPGVYKATIIDSSECEVERWVPINGPLYPGNFDLNESILHTDFRPGHQSLIVIDAYNDGCIPVDGTVRLILDTLLIYQDATTEPDIISGDTLIWNFESLAYDSTHIFSEIHCDIAPGALLLDTINLVIVTEPIIGDIDSTNNIKFCNSGLVNSFDPNCKQVLPQGEGPGGRVRSNLTMSYLIQFQNIGTADAIDIYILDTLDSDLDISSFRMISASHSYTVEFESDHVVKFTFDNIHLPDSASDETNSHGFITYEIRQLPDLVEETEISNSAAIFFDYNQPVITNMVINTIDYDAPNNVDETQQNEIRVYPNPASDFIQLNNFMPFSRMQVFDMYGHELISKLNQNRLDISTLNPGVYIWQS